MQRVGKGQLVIVGGSGPARATAGGTRRPGGRARPQPRATRAGEGALRLTRRGVVVFGLLAVALLVGLLVGMSALLAPSAVADAPGRDPAAGLADPAGGVVVLVRPGDTLWGIARAQSPERDPRDVVAEIVEYNGLPGPALQAGERIVVPTR